MQVHLIIPNRLAPKALQSWFIILTFKNLEHLLFLHIFYITLIVVRIRALLYNSLLPHVPLQPLGEIVD